ncbi:multiple monosaccharide ABC transporter substrate-binding protein [Streptomyces fructofermentans]|uniref:Sugar ABC transporter substrate-binding protein n=1 Tax=Streptomyces fructofermentans TaxID=152141 RepID=A0A918KDZ4_9ACTN|nr:multiple monosaccharide ABC transporter substrate-binding protein [Streptomyces fructofermentans]GGX59794.1 sugar ABC transporter substrate-binding protein [Streptomyces fructofermentans]
MRARTTVAAALSTVLSLSLAGCGESSDTGSGGGAASVGIVMPTKVSQRWINDGQNMVDELKGFGYKTTLKYADNDPKTQVAQVEAMIADGVDALVIASVDGRAFKGVLGKAKAAHIPVISYDRLILGSDAVDYYATFDNVKVGHQQADFLVERLGLVNGTGKGPFTVELFAGSADDNNTRFFYDASMEVLKPYIENGDLIVRSGDTELEEVTTLRWDGVAAEKRMNKVLDSDYTDQTLDAVLSPYDGMSIGIIKALKKHGYGVPGKPLPIVTGQDAEVPSIKSIIGGEQSQTVYKDTRELALVTSYMVNSVVHGKKPAINDTSTYDNGEKVVPAYLLEPVSVDKGNYESVLLDSGYLKKSDLK